MLPFLVLANQTLKNVPLLYVLTGMCVQVGVSLFQCACGCEREIERVHHPDDSNRGGLAKMKRKLSKEGNKINLGVAGSPQITILHVSVSFMST